jgi:predicted peroxiredoxin
VTKWPFLREEDDGLESSLRSDEKSNSPPSKRAKGSGRDLGARREDAMETNGKMLIFCGSGEPLKAFPPFMLGSGALAMDMELTLFFTMTGLNIVRKGGAEKIALPGAPKTIPEFLEIMREGGAKMIACSAAFPIVGIKEEDLIEGVECGGVATFVNVAQEASAVLTFC